MISAEKFVDILESKDLLPPDMLVKVRKQIADSGQTVSASKVASALINAGHLTKAMAKRLLEAAETEEKGPVSADEFDLGLADDDSGLAGDLDVDDLGLGAPAGDKSPPDDDFGLGSDDELGLAPVEGEKKPKKPADDEELGLAPIEGKKKPKPADDDELGLLPVDGKKKPPKEPEEELGLAPVKEQKKTGKPAKDDLGLQPVGEKKKAEDHGLTRIDKKKGDVSEAKKSGKPKQDPEMAETAIFSITDQAKQEKKAAAKAEQDPGLVPLDKAGKPPAQDAGGSLLDEELAPMDDAGGAGTSLDLMDGDLSGADAEAGNVLAPVQKKPGLIAMLLGLLKGGKGKQKKKKKKENVWDSSLLLISGGALLLLVLMFFALYWAIGKASGDDMATKIAQQYNEQSWTQVISSVEQYLEEFPNHSGVSRARVMRGVAQLRRRGPNNPTDALVSAKQVLTEITPEKEFAESAADVGDVLLLIGEALAEDARKQTDQELVDDAIETLDLVKKVVPEKRQQQKRMRDLAEHLAETQHDIDRIEALQAARNAIYDAVEVKDTAKAYQVRADLLQKFPRLAGEPTLEKAVEAISKALEASVALVGKQVPAETTPLPSEVISTVSLSQTVLKRNVPAVEGRIIFGLVDGVAHGLDASTGRLLWRRFVGTGSTGRGIPFPPTPISTAAGSDALMVDPVRNEVLRVKATTGDIVWRHAVGEAFDSHPMIADRQVLVATPSGRLVMIDVESGNSTSYIQLPQGLRVAPGADEGRGLLFQPAEHHNMFVLSQQGTCQQVVYLGHDKGTITAAPVMAGSYLLLAVNDLAEDSTLHLLSVGLGTGPDAPVCKKMQQIRLKGHVDMSPLVEGRTVLVTTDLGAVYVFDLGGGPPEAPLAKVAEKTSTSRKKNLVRYAMMKSGFFWLADVELTKYAILTSRKRLALKWTIDENNVFLQPPVSYGEATFQVRRRMGMPGAIVSAVAQEEPTIFWETRIATPLASEPIVDAKTSTVTAVTKLSSLFRFSAAKLKPHRVENQPTVALPPAQVLHPFKDVIQLRGGLLAISGGKGTKNIPIFDPQLTAEGVAKRFRHVILSEPLATDPIAFGSGLLTPTETGHIFVMNPQTGAELCEPFAPRLGGTANVQWQGPAVLNKTQVIIADGANKIYRLGVRKEPKLHLAAFNEEEVTEPIVTRAAVLKSPTRGDMTFMVDKRGMFTAYEAATFEPIWQHPLAGHVIWGPKLIGNHVFFATNDDKLFCVDGDRLVWDPPLALKYGSLAGTPLAANGNLILASVQGVIWSVSTSGENPGQELGKINTGCPLATGPVLKGGNLIVGGHDGSLYEIKHPTVKPQ